MAKTITISYDNKNYTLEYTRKTVKALEQTGFTVNGVIEQPVTNIPRLFFGAFRANHPTMKAKLADEIYDSLARRDELIDKLLEMYSDTIETLTASDSESSEGNADWAADF